MKKITIITNLTLTFIVVLFAQILESKEIISDNPFSKKIDYKTIFDDDDPFAKIKPIAYSYGLISEGLGSGIELISKSPSINVCKKDSIPPDLLRINENEGENGGNNQIKVGLGSEIELISKEYRMTGKYSSPLLFHGSPNNNGANLEWNAHFNKNTSHFLLEHSTDSISFTKICRINGEGHISENQAYEFIDGKHDTRNHYYRIRVIAKNGDDLESKIIRLLYTQNKSDLISVYPNPNKGETLFCKYETGEAGNINIRILDASGKIILTQEQHIAQGLNILRVDISSLNEGFFMVNVEKNRKTTIQRFIIIK